VHTSRPVLNRRHTLRRAAGGPWTRRNRNEERNREQCAFIDQVKSVQARESGNRERPFGVSWASCDADPASKGFITTYPETSAPRMYQGSAQHSFHFQLDSNSFNGRGNFMKSSLRYCRETQEIEKRPITHIASD
jgi:hypothetical protein